MKALIYKDFVCLKSQLLTYLGILTIWFVVFGINRQFMIMPMMIAFLSTMIVINLFYTDSAYSFDNFVFYAPVSKFKVVVSRYLIGLLVVLLSSIITMVVYVMMGQLNLENMIVLITISFMMIVMQSIIIPSFIRFGSKSLGTIFVVIYLFIFVIYQSAQNLNLLEYPFVKSLIDGVVGFFKYFENKPPVIGMSLLFGVMMVIALCVMATSMKISVNLYKKKEF